MKITYLGTGNAFAPQRDWASILVNDGILLDAGPSLLVNLKRLGIDPAAIHHIFISHIHADHFFGLPFLLLDYYFLSKTQQPLTLIGPPGMEARLKHLMALAYPELADRDWPRPMTFVEAAAGTVQTVNGLSFSAVPMVHLPELLTAFGYRLQLADGILAYSGDTAMTPALSTLMADARVCILEATAQDVSPVHLGRDAIRQLRAQAPAGCAILLNHLDTPDAAAWQGMDVLVPQDHQVYEFHVSGGAEDHSCH